MSNVTDMGGNTDSTLYGSNRMPLQMAMNLDDIQLTAVQMMHLQMSMTDTEAKDNMNINHKRVDTDSLINSWSIALDTNVNTCIIPELNSVLPTITALPVPVFDDDESLSENDIEIDNTDTLLMGEDDEADADEELYNANLGLSLITDDGGLGNMEDGEEERKVEKR